MATRNRKSKSSPSVARHSPSRGTKWGGIKHTPCKEDAVVVMKRNEEEAEAAQGGRYDLTSFTTRGSRSGRGLPKPCAGSLCILTSLVVHILHRADLFVLWCACKYFRSTIVNLPLHAAGSVALVTCLLRRYSECDRCFQVSVGLPSCGNQSLANEISLDQAALRFYRLHTSLLTPSSRLRFSVLSPNLKHSKSHSSVDYASP